MYLSIQIENLLINCYFLIVFLGNNLRNALAEVAFDTIASCIETRRRICFALNDLIVQLVWGKKEGGGIKGEEIYSTQLID